MASGAVPAAGAGQPADHGPRRVMLLPRDGKQPGNSIAPAGTPTVHPAVCLYSVSPLSVGGGGKCLGTQKESENICKSLSLTLELNAALHQLGLTLGAWVPPSTDPGTEMKMDRKDAIPTPADFSSLAMAGRRGPRMRVDLLMDSQS